MRSSASTPVLSCQWTGGATDAEWITADPRNDPTDVVLVAAIVNRMKVDMTIPRWEAMIQALYEYRIKGNRPFDKSALPANWGAKSSARARSRRSKASKPG